MTIDWELPSGWMRRFLRGVALVAAVAALAYWYLAPIPATGYSIAKGEVVAEVMGTGTLEGRLKSTISPKIAGRVREILVDQGDHIRAGDLLFTLDDAELTQQVEIARATTVLAQASLERLRADHDQAQAVLENARNDYDRIQQLLPSNAVTIEEGDAATERLRIAEAGLARSVAALTEGQKQIISTEKTLAYNEALLADTQVVAPFDGLIVKRYRDPGDIGVAGSPVLMLVSTAEMWVSAWVDETEMARLHPGQAARVVFRSEAGTNYAGQVARLGLEADRETREFVVDVRVPTLPENWAVGQRADVYIEVGRKQNVPLVPAKFIFWQDSTPGVYVSSGGRAQWRKVTLGLSGSEAFEVSNGISAGDIVLVPAAGRNVSLHEQRVAVR